MQNLTELSAAEMARLVNKKEISPVELVEAHLSRIQKLNPHLNAFVSMDVDRVRAQARAAEGAVRAGGSIGRLQGVPVSIKSSIDVAGLKSEAGTRLRAGYSASADAPLVARLRAAGAIVLGTTNTPELLMAYETDNLLYGPSRNPWDLDRTPGGSSGGESAAIAACCSAGGVGSDGGGSIRVPAHFTGICGLKPTPGRIPATGHFPPSAGPFTMLGVVGPMARTIADIRLLFEVMAGPDDGDSCAAPVPSRDLGDLKAHKLKIGYFEDDGRTPVTAETRTAIRTAATSLKDAGFDVQPFRPDGLERARQLWWLLFGLAGGVVLGPLLEGRDADLSPILKQFRTYVDATPPLTLDSFMNALLERDAVRTRLLRQMSEFPILLCPVCSVPAFRHHEREWTIDGQTVGYLDAMSYTQWFNLTGNPGAVVPVGQSPEGLPIGVQIVGKPWEEEFVLAVAEIIEKQCGGWKEPKVSARRAGSR